MLVELNRAGRLGFLQGTLGFFPLFHWLMRLIYEYTQKSMNVCIYMYVSLYACWCVCMCVYKCMCVEMYICMYIYLSISVCLSMYVCMYVCIM